MTSDSYCNQRKSLTLLQHFQDTNLRLFTQNARPRWMGKPLSPPILPGNVCFPDWGKTLKKIETKFQCKVNKYLPSLIESLDSAIMKKQNENFEKVIFSVVDTSPGQKRRAEAIFLLSCSRKERVHLTGNRQRRHLPTSSASGSSDNSFFQHELEFLNGSFQSHPIFKKRNYIVFTKCSMSLFWMSLFHTFILFRYFQPSIKEIFTHSIIILPFLHSQILHLFNTSFTIIPPLHFLNYILHIKIQNKYTDITKP